MIMEKNKNTHWLYADKNFEYYGYRVNGTNLITNVYSLNSNTEYKIDIASKTIVCIIQAEDYGKTFSAKTKLREGDKFDLKKGMEIARLKATLKLKKFEYNFANEMADTLSDEIYNMKSMLFKTINFGTNAMIRIESLEDQLEKLMDRHAE